MDTTASANKQLAEAQDNRHGNGGYHGGKRDNLTGITVIGAEHLGEHGTGHRTWGCNADQQDAGYLRVKGQQGSHGNGHQRNDKQAAQGNQINGTVFERV